MIPPPTVTRQCFLPDSEENAKHYHVFFWALRMNRIFFQDTALQVPFTPGAIALLVTSAETVTALTLGGAETNSTKLYDVLRLRPVPARHMAQLRLGGGA
jgi:hypothetical protein